MSPHVKNSLRAYISQRQDLGRLRKIQNDLEGIRKDRSGLLNIFRARDESARKANEGCDCNNVTVTVTTVIQSRCKGILNRNRFALAKMKML